MPDAAPPSSPSARLVGIDLARSLAILGMIIVNFCIVMTGLSRSGSGPSDAAWWYAQCSGRASAAFVVLAGIGISLLTQRARLSGELMPARRALWRRAAFLFAIGLAFQLVWPGDILHYYGAYLAIAALFIGSRNRTLWLAAVASVLLFCGAYLLLDYGRGWNWFTLEYRGFWTLDGFTRNLLFNGFHPVAPWLAFLFAGMALGRADLRSRAVQLRWVIGGATVCAAALLSAELIIYLTDELPQAERFAWAAWATTSSIPPMPLYLLQSGGLAVAAIGLCLFIGSTLPRWATWPLVATGQIALSIYILHVLLGLGVIEELWGGFDSADYSVGFAMRASLAFFACAVAFACLIRWRFARGPLEAVMRGISR